MQARLSSTARCSALADSPVRVDSSFGIVPAVVCLVAMGGRGAEPDDSSRGKDTPALPFHGLQQLLERAREELHALREQPAGDLLHADAGLREQVHRAGGGIDVLGEARARPPLGAKRGAGGGGGWGGGLW